MSNKNTVVEITADAIGKKCNQGQGFRGSLKDTKALAALLK
jgi:hypothetical protein